MERMDTTLSEYLFHRGTNYRVYDYLGAHRLPADGEGGPGYVFRTWAPRAQEVTLLGDFVGWETGIPMRRTGAGGIWEATFATHGSLSGQKYKLRIQSAAGVSLKGDPFALASEGGTCGASVIVDPTAYDWQDAEFLEHRFAALSGDRASLGVPIHIYGVHAPSFAHRADGGLLSYRELADILVPYVKHMGYTHVGLLPLAEYPYDGSLGYGTCAYYAPTARLGGPDDFRYLVDALHAAGVGVLMDWTPVCFPKDGWGPVEFDGAPLYECGAGPRADSCSWGMRYFDVARPEVQSFLISCALFWLREYHIDGLRIGTLASLLLQGADAAAPMRAGCLEDGAAFLRRLVSAVREEFPDALMIAEERGGVPGMTAPLEEGGFGFSLKQSLDIPEDFFLYLGKDPIFRRHHHAALTGPLSRAFGERYLAAVTHDDLMHGRGSLLARISGTDEEKRTQLRAALVYLCAFPGKKYTFMGCELGQMREWDHRTSLDWHLLDDPAHLALRDFVAALNQFYLAHPALWAADFSPMGFSWVARDRADENIVAFCRHAPGGETLTVVASFNGADLPACRLPLAAHGQYRVAFSSAPTGGEGAVLHSREDEEGIYLTLPLPARTALILERVTPGLSLHITRARTVRGAGEL